EDGIRDLTVTGVQTCALPILDRRSGGGRGRPGGGTGRGGGHRRGSQELGTAQDVGRVREPLAVEFLDRRAPPPQAERLQCGPHRSEERRGGKGWRGRGARQR